MGYSFLCTSVTLFYYPLPDRNPFYNILYLVDLLKESTYQIITIIHIIYPIIYFFKTYILFLKRMCHRHSFVMPSYPPIPAYIPYFKMRWIIPVVPTSLAFPFSTWYIVQRVSSCPRLHVDVFHYIPAEMY